MRGAGGPVGLALVGLAILAGSMLDLGKLWLFAGLGVFLLVGGAYLLYDRRKRIQQAGPASG